MLHVGDDDGELEVSGLFKAALAFYSACFLFGVLSLP